MISASEWIAWRCWSRKGLKKTRNETAQAAREALADNSGRRVERRSRQRGIRARFQRAGNKRTARPGAALRREPRGVTAARVDARAEREAAPYRLSRRAGCRRIDRGKFPLLRLRYSHRDVLRADADAEGSRGRDACTARVPGTAGAARSARRSIERGLAAAL